MWCEEMLDEFADKVLREADKYKDLSEKEPLGSIKNLNMRAYSDGLYMAVAFLSLTERRHKKRLEKIRNESKNN